MPLILILLGFVFNIKSEQIFRYSDNYHLESEYVKTITRIVSGRYALQNGRFEYIINVINSSAGINTVLFDTDGRSIAGIDSNSHLWTRYCTIEINHRNSSSGLICDGGIFL